MKAYLELLKDVLANGQRVSNRTGIDTLSVFGRQFRVNLAEGFPLVTTKKVHFKSVVHELIWMLSGNSRIDYLRENKVRIWDEWASVSYRPELGYEDGDLGPVYGVQWRSWRAIGRPPSQYVYNIDQIETIVNQLRNDPTSRRIILSAWNAGQIHLMKLPPCHCFAQFLVRNGQLSCLVYLRSWDLFLGGPFNIAQYALLTHVLAHVAGYGVGELIVTSGDTHIYVNHLEQVEEQLSREPKEKPGLVINAQVGEVDELRYEDVMLLGYDPHPHIAGEVAV